MKRLIAVFIMFVGVSCYAAVAPQVAIQTTCINDACTTYSLIIYPYTNKNTVASVSADTNRVRLTIRNPSSGSATFFVSESSISTISGDPVYATEIMVERYYRGKLYFVTTTSTITVNAQIVDKPY